MLRTKPKCLVGTSPPAPSRKPHSFLSLSLSKPCPLRESPTKERCQKAIFLVAIAAYSSEVASHPSPGLSRPWIKPMVCMVDKSLPLVYNLGNLPAFFRGATSLAPISGTPRPTQEWHCSNKPVVRLFPFGFSWLAVSANLLWGWGRKSITKTLD